MDADLLRKKDWYVHDAKLADGQNMVREHHYAKGGSNTCVYMHGLFRGLDDKLFGVAWWLPPTRVACESVNRENWKKVLSLTRLVLLPETPKNACSFLLGKSIKLIKKDKRFVSLVTYADDAQGHAGQIYRAANWDYVGKTGPYPKWIDPTTGRQVSQKSTKNRRKEEMESLGYTKTGPFFKHKYVMHLRTNMRESDIEKKICEYVRKRGGIPYKFTSPQRVNVPDRIIVLPGGVLLFLELKATGKKPTKGQYREMDRLRDLGQYVYWSDSIELAKFIIDFHMW